MRYSCEFCDIWSYNKKDLDEHEESNHPSCDTCERMFRNHDARRMHYLNSSHHNYCGICDRDFQSLAALRGHQERHLPRDIRCPNCDRGFPSASAMAKHLSSLKAEVATGKYECGKYECGGGVGKVLRTHTAAVGEKVRDWEVRSGNPNLLTVPRLGYSDNCESAGPIMATAAAYNGCAYECYFCNREFGTLGSLNQHLNSGVHLTKEFRCRKCGHTAGWLSGLIAHIESEICGFMSRSDVRNLATPLAQLRLGN